MPTVFFNGQGKRVSNLTPMGWATLAIILATGLTGGGLLGYMINDWTSDKPTTLNVTVSAGFGASVKQGSTVTAAFDASFKCAEIGMTILKVGMADYDGIYNYLKGHPGSRFADGNATTVSGNTWHPFAMTMEVVAEEFFGLFSTPSVDANFDGQSHTFDMGHYAVIIPIVQVICYIESSPVSVGFTWQSIIDFMDLMTSTGANFDEFSTAGFLLGENSMTINELKYDSLHEYDSLLSVVFNGVAMDLVYASL